MTASPTFDIVLVDADVISKLAHWELLELLPQAFGLPWQSFSTTPSVMYRARKANKKPDRLFRSQTAVDCALHALSQMGLMPATLDRDFILAAQRVPAIDPGEAVLLATAVVHPKACILTGDKRALAAVANAAQPLGAGRLKGRIICLEQCILHALERIGLEALRSHLCREPVVDRVIAAAMGSTCTASEADVREGLESYIRDAMSNSRGLLAVWP